MKFYALLLLAAATFAHPPPEPETTVPTTVTQTETTTPTTTTTTTTPAPANAVTTSTPNTTVPPTTIYTVTPPPVTTPDNSGTVTPSLHSYPASVRKYPNELHLCSAMFVSHSTLLTTARCILNESPEDIYIYYDSNQMDADGKLVTVKHLIPHPKYDAYPQKNDIGIIITTVTVKTNYHKLPSYWPDFQGRANVYVWGFTDKHQGNFTVQSKVADLVSNAKCSLSLDEYIDCNYLCGSADDVQHGSLDLGTGMTGLINKTSYIIALYNNVNRYKYKTTDKYELIFQYTPWINETIAKYPVKDGSGMTSGNY